MAASLCSVPRISHWNVLRGRDALDGRGSSADGVRIVGAKSLPAVSLLVVSRRAPPDASTVPRSRAVLLCAEHSSNDVRLQPVEAGSQELVTEDAAVERSGGSGGGGVREG